MKYYFVTDFGSSNSGCAFMEEHQEEPRLLHYNMSDPAHYAKEETRFGIHREFLNRLKNNFSIPDTEFHIKSDTKPLYSTEKPNIVWRNCSINNFHDENFVYYSHFKMGLYNGESTVKGSDGKDQPIGLIIKIFLRILKIDAYYAFEAQAGCNLSNNDKVYWGVTIPSIWGDSEKRLMRETASSVYGEDVTILSEPQGALTYYANFAGQGNEGLKDSRISVVVDAGGGTTDLACILETTDNYGNFTLKSVSLPDGVGKGGNDIDEEFWIDLCDYLIQKSGSQAKYGRIMDLFSELIGNYFDASPEGRNEFYNSWRKLQFDRYERNSNSLDFSFNKGYIRWLRDNNHEEIAAYIRSEEGDVPIDAMLIDKCHSEVIHKGIIPKVESFIEESFRRQHRIDRIVLAGGLSYTEPFRKEILSLARKYGDIDVQSCSMGKSSGYGAVSKSSGAVLMGAVYQLAHPELMVYTAVKSVFYDIYTTKSKLLEIRMKEYKPFKFAEVLFPSDTPAEQSRKLLAKLEDYSKKSSMYETVDSDGDVHSLSPICIKGCLATTFKAHRKLQETNQRTIDLSIYASDNPFVLYYGDKDTYPLNPQKIHIELPCAVENITIKIEVNNAQNGNPIIFSVFDENQNLLGKEFISAQFRQGY